MDNKASNMMDWLNKMRKNRQIGEMKNYAKDHNEFSEFILTALMLSTRPALALRAMFEDWDIARIQKELFSN